MPRNPIAIALAAVLILHFVLLAISVVPSYTSPDADGYFGQAGLLVTQGRLTFEAQSPAQFFGLHWLQMPDGRFISRYPPGFPLLIAAVWKLFGRAAIFYLNPLLATLTLLILFLFTRAYLGGLLGLAAAAIYALNPLANRHAVFGDSHTAATFVLLGGFWLLDAWIRSSGRFSWLRAIGAGLLLGYIPMVRYAEVVAVAGCALLVLLQWNKVRERLPQLAALWGAFAIPPLYLAVANHIHYGAFWKTGYALTNEQQVALDYVARNWLGYAGALLSPASLGAFFAIGVAGLAAMIARRETRALGAALAVSAGSITAVYLGYYSGVGPDDSALRFLLPTFPLYVLPALWLLRQIPNRMLANTALAALLTLHTAYSLPRSIDEVVSQHQASERSAKLLAWAEANIPPGSVILATELNHQALNFLWRWKLADVSLTGVIPNPFNLGGPATSDPQPGDGEDRPMPMQVGKAEALRARYRGLAGSPLVQAIFADARFWASPQAVYFLGGAASAQTLAQDLDGTARLEPVGIIELGGRHSGLSGNVQTRLRIKGKGPPGAMPDFGPQGTVHVFRIQF